MLDPKATRLLGQLSAKYFASSLREWRVYRVEFADPLTLGECNYRTKTIFISGDISDTDPSPIGLRATLLHEMTHAFTGEDHGIRFRHYVSVLRASGETVSAGRYA
jgi:hypothetical protein